VTVIGFLAALVLAPWVHPLAFQPLAGWQTGAGGTTRSQYGGSATRLRSPTESAAWIATRVRYTDKATADPPNATLAHLPHDGVIVWAVIFDSGWKGETRIHLDMAQAKRFDCCEASRVVGGEYEVSGYGLGGRYSVIVRVYFGSTPTRVLRAHAQHALDRLRLPASR
jgi:hypothetical protein